MGMLGAGRRGLSRQVHRSELDCRRADISGQTCAPKLDSRYANPQDRLHQGP
jgi:hypothetical protein